MSFFPPKDRLHPNEKPIGLVQTFLSCMAMSGDTVFDPFMGSGTTLRAAKDLQMRAFGCDVEEKYCEIAAQRLSQECLPIGIPTISLVQDELM